MNRMPSSPRRMTLTGGPTPAARRATRRALGAAGLVGGLTAWACGGGGDGITGGPSGSGGSIRVSVSTNGVDLDPDGYATVVDGVATESIERDGTVTLQVSRGRHTVELSDVANNCSVRGQPSLAVNVEGGGTASASFELDCTELPAVRDAIAFSRRDSDGSFSIHLMNLDGSGVRQLTDPADADDRQPAISPDGKRIAFVRSRVTAGRAAIYGGEGRLTDELWVMHSDGDEQNKLVCGLRPTWSRNGHRIAFRGVDGAGASCWPINRGGVWSVWSFAFGITFTIEQDSTKNSPNETGFNATVFLLNRAASDPSWSPDGSRIAYVDDQRIMVMDPDGSDRIAVTVSNDQFRQDRAPAWSPDGTRLAFESERDGNWDVYVIKADGTGEVRVTTDVADDRRPTWSSDGTRLFFTSDRDGNVEIYAVNVAGGGAVNLTRHAEADVDPNVTR